MSDFMGLAAAFGLALLNAFFVAAEFSLVSVRRSRIEALIKQGNATAKVVYQAISDLDRYIAATQLGITIASLALGWVGEPALGHYIEPVVESILEPVLHLLPEGGVETISGAAIGGAIAFIIITTLHVVVGELVPKSLALQNPEQTSLWVARPMVWVTSLFRFPIWVLNGAGNALLRLMGVNTTGDEHQRALSVEELKILVRSSEESGVVHEDEREIIDAVFEIRDLMVRQVMVPRTEMDMCRADATLEEIVGYVVQAPYTKFPVYDQDYDHIIGVLYVKDLIGPKTAENPAARDLCAEALFVPETLPVIKLMELFRASGKHIAIVHDEFGGTEGLVTLDDVLGKIVGELPDRYEYELNEPSEVISREDDFLVCGLMPLEEFNEAFGVHLMDHNYNTIGGYIMGRLNRIPQEEDMVEAQGLVLRVETMDQLRIDRLSVSLNTPAPEEVV